MNEDLRGFQPAPIGRRLIAFVIDFALISLILYVVSEAAFALFIGSLGLPTPESLATLDPAEQVAMAYDAILAVPAAKWLALFVIILVCSLGFHGYYVFFESRHGATPGKKLMGLEVVSVDGQPLGRDQVLYREIVRWYFDVPFVLPAIISISVTSKRQRVGDLAGKTMVIRKRS